MADMLNTGVTALMAFRSALDTVGNNISNASTAGYNRQRVELATQQNGGVLVQQIARMTDASVYARSLSDGSSLARLDAFSNLATRMDGILSNTDSGLAKPLQQFFAAVDGVSADPQSTAARQNLLSVANNLAARFNDLQAQLDGAEKDINMQLSQSVSDINELTTGIARLNERISMVFNSGNQTPNDLMDQRDAMITQLSQMIGVSTVKQDDGSVNVFAAGGQTLVMGNSSNTMRVVGSTYDQSRLEIALGNPPVNITARASGGKIGGLLDARSQLIDPIQSQLGRGAAALVTAFNAQHVQGIDQNGNAGQPFFNAISGNAAAANSNGGSATVAVGFSNISQLTGENYKLSYDGASWSLTSASTGSSVALSGTGTPADPFIGAGISLVVSGAANAGDSYLVQPTATVAGQVGVALTQPSRIAAASVAFGGVNSADNTNSKLLGAISGLGLLDGGRSSVTAANASLISQTGSMAQQAGSRRDAAAAIQTQTQKDMDAVSGVNLDEEAADLVRYQQAYQAAAQIISTAQTVFQALLNAARG